MYSFSERDLSARTCVRVLDSTATQQAARHVYPWWELLSQRRELSWLLQKKNVATSTLRNGQQHIIHFPVSAVQPIQ